MKTGGINGPHGADLTIFTQEVGRKHLRTGSNVKKACKNWVSVNGRDHYSGLSRPSSNEMKTGGIDGPHGVNLTIFT